MSGSKSKSTSQRGVLATETRVTTGNADADAILGGGFLANSINIIMGAPGTGKTLFAQQLALNNADAKRPVLYFTTLSEPLSKVVTYLQSMSFYDEAKVGSAVLYEDLGNALVTEGPSAVVVQVSEAIKQNSPHVIVIDSFKAVHDLASSVAEMRRMVADLAGLLSAYDTTTFLVGEYEESEEARYPEFAVADGIIEFARYKETARDERYVRVSKLRGAGYREGLHGFRITDDGLEFFARLISPEFPPAYTASPDRISTGIAGLDAMLGGGIWAGSSTLLIGPTGCGKTTAAVQFCLAGVRQGEPALYVNFQENPTQLGRLVHSLSGGHVEGLADRWHAMYVSPVELQIDSLVGRAFAMVREHRVRRLVIDGVADLLFASRDLYRVHDYLYALSQQLAVSEVTSLFTFESGLGAGQTGRVTEELRFSSLTDCIIMLDLEATDRLRRSMSIRKLRNSAHDLRIVEFEITAAGLQVGRAQTT
jgi:circadian clock protein KaiC